MCEAKVSCIHVVKPSPIDVIKEQFLSGSNGYKEALRKAKMVSENALGHILDVIAREIGVDEVEVDLKIVSGVLSKSIMTYAESIKADIVIIGTDSGSRFSRTSHTNLALNMIKLEKANVLLVPSDFKMERIDQIGGFINFEMDDINFIDRLIRLANSTEGDVKLINVVQKDQSLEKAEKLLHRFKRILAAEVKERKISFAIESDSLPNVVNGLKLKHNIDLMIIRAYKRHWDIYNSSSSFADTVIKNIRCPLLVLKNNRIVIKE
jgi:nucleotide-binding universal stress UspA family protein